jgi:hypothetical protein
LAWRADSGVFTSGQIEKENVVPETLENPTIDFPFFSRKAIADDGM